MVPYLFRARNPLLQRHAKGDPELVCDVLCLGHHRGRELAARRVLTDAGECRACEGTDRVECHVAPELQPDLGADVIEHRRFQAGPGQRVSHTLHPLAGGSIRLAYRKPIALDMLDDTVRDELGRRIHDAADHPLPGNVLPDHTCWISAVHAGTCQLAAMTMKVPIRNTVLHWDNHCIVTEQFRDIGCNRCNLVSLHGEDDHILRSGSSIVRDCIDARQRLLSAIRHDETQAVGA